MCRHYGEGKGVEEHTYRFFTSGSAFQDLLVNPGFGDLRASFTNEHIPQPLKVCANEKGCSRFLAVFDLSGPSTESRSYVASRLPNLSSGKSRAWMYSTVLETRVVAESLDLSAWDISCQRLGALGVFRVSPTLK